VTLRNCEDGFEDRLLANGTLMEVRLASGSIVTTKVYLLSEAAKVIGRGNVVLGRWIKNGQWPKPAIHRKNTEYYKYFSEVQLVALAKVLSEHEKDNPYYQTNHDETREKLFAAFEEASKGMEPKDE